MSRGYVAATCLRDVSHVSRVQHVEQVELHWARRGDKITPKLVLHDCKSISSHEGNMSLQHVPATFSCVCTCCDFVPATRPCYMSAQCVLHKFFVLQHDPLCLPTLRKLPKTCRCLSKPNLKYQFGNFTHGANEN